MDRAVTGTSTASGHAPVAPAVPVVVPAPAVAAPEPAAAEAAPGPDREVVRQAVLDLVAEKTGYPQDMLDPELDMEADLGVDTVKQAEIFAVIRDTYGIQRDESLKLRDFPTINHVIGFVMDRAVTRTSTASGHAPVAPAVPVVVPEPVATAPEPAAAEAAPGPDREVVRQAVLDLVAEKTGYPQDMLDPELDMEADLGVDTVKQAEIFAVIRDTYGIQRDESLKLRDFPTINHVIGFVMDRAAVDGKLRGTSVVTPV